jgi:hypothetical protein
MCSDHSCRAACSAYLLFLTVLLLPLVAAAQQAKAPVAISRTFPQSKVRVWNALIGAIAANDLFPQESDERACTMSFHDQGVETVRWGSANKAVAALTTKNVSPRSAWQMLNIFGSVACSQADDGRTEVRIEFRFEGNNAVSSNWEKLASRGTLEEIIFRATEIRLADPAAKPASKKPS